MNRKNPRVIAGLAAIALIATAGLLVAGPLDPPAGPISSTYKTLTEVEPRIAVSATNTPGDADSLFRITQPGSYYLTGNITGEAGKHGIEIEASGVTLDLNGMDVQGVAGAFAGVVAYSGFADISIVNGSVRFWPGAFGVVVDGERGHVERIRASSNLGGIDVGSGSVVSECIAEGNSSDGIRAASNCRISDCTATGNLVNGIKGFLATSVTNCSVTDSGWNGIEVYDGSVVTNCSLRDIEETGIKVNDACVVTNCSVELSTPFPDAGIRGRHRCTITGCTVRGGLGIVVSTGCTVSGCTVTGITAGDSCTIADCTSDGSNTGSGIVIGASGSVIGCAASYNSVGGIITGARCTVTNCTTNNNQGAAGINAGTGSSVTGCTSGNNAGDGIVASTECHVRGNTCQANGVNPGTGAGINCTGSLNRLEDNVCTGADYGIFVAGIRNVMTRNTCGGNLANWSVVAGNYGLVVNPSTTTAIVGNTGGATINTDPNANYTY